MKAQLLDTSPNRPDIPEVAIFNGLESDINPISDVAISKGFKPFGEWHTAILCSEGLQFPR